MKHALLVVGVATTAVLMLMLAGFMFVTWGIDFSSLDSSDRGGLLCIFALMEILSLFITHVFLDDYR